MGSNGGGGGEGGGRRGGTLNSAKMSLTVSQLAFTSSSYFGPCGWVVRGGVGGWGGYCFWAVSAEFVCAGKGLEEELRVRREAWRRGDLDDDGAVFEVFEAAQRRLAQLRRPFEKLLLSNRSIVRHLMFQLNRKDKDCYLFEESSNLPRRTPPPFYLRWGRRWQPPRRTTWRTPPFACACGCAPTLASGRVPIKKRLGTSKKANS
jgi:hypothetical protein